MDNISKGKVGEIKALQYLIDNGYKILAKNFKNKLGEIDIIACEKDVLVFIEVKSRSNKDYGYGREAVTKHKQHKIKLVAQTYIKKYSLYDCPCRFDVIEIYLDSLEHIQNAFC